jgi:hypothetical protein
LESMEESAAKFEGEIGQWEEILKWAYQLAQLVTEALCSCSPSFVGRKALPLCHCEAGNAEAISTEGRG